MSIGSNSVDAKHLRAFIERVERLEEEKRAIADDIKEVYAEAKGTGFDPKTIRQIIKLRAMTADARAEQEALLDIYKAALGMLDGTPLGEAAIRRLTEKPAEPPPRPDADPEMSTEPPIEAKPQPAEEPALSVDDARAMGSDAAKNGKPVTSNPFPARDPRRAAWDEAWCAHAGNDGMEIPEAWRRKPKKKPERSDPAPKQ